jgi:hypothetical protein
LVPPADSPSFYFGYTDLIFIFDSSDWVYLCLTKTYVNTNSNLNLTKDYKYPNYIGFFPDDFIAFRNEYFLDFIKDNDDIFQLNTINKNVSLFFIVASTEDTIKNKSFYDLRNLVNSNKIGFVSRVRYMVRKTTEEENQVIYHKKNKVLYEPYKLNWSKHFITGEFKPFTLDYDSIEQITWRLIRPREDYFKESIKEKRVD